MRTNVVIVRDHSGSMRNLAKKALNDYNLTLAGVKESASEEKQNTFLSVVECGIGPMGKVNVRFNNVHVDQIKSETSYSTTGGATPLFDSVGQAIDAALLGADEDTAFLVMVVTDGYENASRIWNARTISTRINELQKTDRWTFVFRVPRGSKRDLAAMGIPSENILEWEQTEESLVKSTEHTVAGIKNYFSGRTRGLRSSSSFYANVGDIPKSVIKENLDDCTGKFGIYHIPQSCDGMQIQKFCEDYGPAKYNKGDAYYQLTKYEKDVQDYKPIAILDRDTGKIYSGSVARDLLGIPKVGTIHLSPGKTGNYDVFIQSTSVNRKLVGGTKLLYAN